ncbi:hypothetical protein ATANTOWER_029558 [Ataeniobius toweri]|uniref:Echinoderm microtubule-associated protein-like 1 n=1 Tax=Ataeniobius toweri TaxID=208326 RepID=A0ABU7BNU1_9TELE|nr:hypothetical protein [Ataeniobius toweri]
MEVTDRIASLEQRVQMQEDEIQLLKSALADVVRRLNLSEEQQATGSRRGPTKARPMIATLPLRPTVNNGTVLPKKGSSTLPSPAGSGSRKDASPAINKSTVRRASSNEHVGTLTRKDSGDSKGNRNRAGSTGSNSSSKRSDSKQRDPVFNAGMRRVTHCKASSALSSVHTVVTVQIYLGPSAQQRGTSRGPAALALTARLDTNLRLISESCRASEAGKGCTTVVSSVRKSPNCALLLMSESLSSLYTPIYWSPVKSPSQYFQICY